MDDRELEARLKTRLHTRFDDPPVPTDLVANVRAATVPTSRVGFDLRSRGRWLGWPAVAAAVAVAVVIVIGGSWIIGPATPQGTSAASGMPSAVADRRFIVLPPGVLPDKSTSISASDVLEARLRQLGIGTFTSSIGYAMQFNVPAEGPSDEMIREVLGATGDVRIVPLPAADYGAGKLTALLGASLPKDEPALFGWDGIESMVGVAFDGAPLLAMTPRPPAAMAFANYVAAHPGETYAVVVDGRVALLPTAQPSVEDGSINLSNGQIPGGSEPSPAYFETVATLAGGLLPEAWRGASVPAIVSEEFAINSAKEQFPYAPVATSDLTAERNGDGWRAVWLVVVTGVVSAVIPCPTSSCPVPSSIRRVVIDGERGNVIRIEMPPD